MALGGGGSVRRVVGAKCTPSGVAKRFQVGAVDRGATLPEFALILPLLMIILFGIIEFGIAFNRVQAIEAAAREGARLASISTTTQGDIDARVADTLVGFSPPMTPMVTGFVSCAGREGDPVQVIVTAPHTVTLPIVGNIWSGNLTGQAVFRCEA